MADLFWLSDEQWAVLEPFMPKNQPGARRVDDRRVISGIVHVLKTGGRWRDCPDAYGPHTTVYNRYNRWSRRGFLAGHAGCPGRGRLGRGDGGPRLNLR
jgi:transposase